MTISLLDNPLDPDPYVTPSVFAQTICDDFAIGFGLGQASELARRKFLDQVVSSIQEQIADFRSHRVEIESRPPERKSTPAPPSSRPASTVGSTLTVNGFNREKSRSRSTTPLPGERERSEKPSSSSLKVPSSTNVASNDTPSKKRARPTNDGSDGTGKFDDEEEEWWERWRKRMRVLDGSGVRRRHRKAATGKKTVHTRKSRSAKGKDQAFPNGVPTNGIKVEINEVDAKNSLVKIEEPDEYQKELLFVNEDEPGLPAGVNEDLRIMIKVSIP